MDLYARKGQARQWTAREPGGSGEPFWNGATSTASTVVGGIDSKDAQRTQAYVWALADRRWPLRWTKLWSDELVRMRLSMRCEATIGFGWFVSVMLALASALLLLCLLPSTALADPPTFATASGNCSDGQLTFPAQSTAHPDTLVQFQSVGSQGDFPGGFGPVFGVGDSCPGLRPPAAGENGWQGEGCRAANWSGLSADRRNLSGACEPVDSLAWEPRPDPGTVAVSTLFRLVCFRGPWRITRVVDRAEEAVDGCDRGAPGGAGCAQGAGDRMRAGAGSGWVPCAGGARVQDHGRRVAGVARLAGGTRGHPGGDGGDRRVLEAGVGDPGAGVQVVSWW